MRTVLSPSLDWHNADALQLEGSGYQYDRNSQRYRSTRSGQWISQSKMDALTGKWVEQQREKVQEIGDRLIDGTINVAEWEKETAKALKQAHLGEYVLGKGGLRRMTQADYGRVGARLRGEYDYLRGFTEAINNNEVGSVEQFKARLDLYVNKTRTTYELGRGEAHLADGFLWERRVLSAAEHCASCPVFAAMGWQPAGTLPRIGEDSECRGNDKCSFEYSRSALRPGDFLPRNGWLGLRVA